MEEPGSVPLAKSLNDIYTDDALPGQTKRWQHLVEQFKTNYGHSPQFVSRSPGRVNIIGEHIDYSLYSVLPMAITADVLLAVSVIDEEKPSDFYTIKISNVQPDKFPSHEFTIPFDSVEIDAKVHEWTNYFKSGLRGALELLRRKRGSYNKPVSVEILVDGTVPAGGGLSSSAAFVSSSALAVMYANGEKAVDKRELTELAIVSERAVGVNSGGMDQAASVLSLRGSALFVSFVPTLTAKPVKFPKTSPELSFVIAQSFVSADKHVTGPVCYNLRVVECSLAAAYLHAKLGKSNKPLPEDSGPLKISLNGFHQQYFRISDKRVEDQLKELIELTKTTLTKDDGYTRAEIASVIGMSVDELNERFTFTFPVRAEHFKLRQRALHVFSEALRVLQFMTILENPASHLSGDTSANTESLNRRLGDLMNETQDSCRELYECSCPEIDQLCDIARRAGSYGSRLTGAGWGGCSVHLVPADKVQAVKEAWDKEYYSKMVLSPEQKESAVVVSKPGSGSAVFVLGGQGVV
ncbi:putative galactokinase protein [Venustampulla echinocandica]|uniref:Galactokinase n=1 Tax=Venustampulla echinocandica TaxID=2656787 RepID=A0A370U2Z4_9HELO|nr:putative galactokinase protein [Venustampulla echinocandica]RDL42148.1 putative galactokinase protein [Venustampulla echinocandica]